MPILTQAKKIGTEAQAPLPPDSYPRLNANGIKCVQQIVGIILYCARAVDMTVLMALSSFAVKKNESNG